MRSGGSRLALRFSMTAHTSKWLVIGLFIIFAVSDARASDSLATKSREERLSQPLPVSIEFIAESDTVYSHNCFPVFRLTVTNTSDHSIRIPTNLGKWCFPFSVEPSGKHSLYPKIILVEFTGTPEETVVLPPGSWFGTSLSHYLCLKEPGDWRIGVTLCIPEGNSSVPMEPGRVTSDIILVTAVP